MRKVIDNLEKGRAIFLNPFAELPELRGIGRTEIDIAMPKLHVELAPDCMNFYLAYKGFKVMQSQGVEYSLKGGEYFVTPPGVTHTTGPMPVSKCAHYWLSIDLTQTPFLGSGEYQEIHEKLKNLGTMKGVLTDICLDTVRRMFTLTLEDDGPMVALEVRLQFSLFLIKFLEGVKNDQSRKVHPAMESAKSWMARHIGEDLPMRAVAEHVGYSLSSFQALFRQHEGIAPAQYFTHLKMKQAEDWLVNTEKSVVQISRELGYATPRYFSTVFKRYHALTPIAFRESKR